MYKRVASLVHIALTNSGNLYQLPTRSCIQAALELYHLNSSQQRRPAARRAAAFPSLILVSYLFYSPFYCDFVAAL